MLLRHRHARLHVHDRQRWPRPAQLQQLAQALASGRQGHERRHAQGLREGSARTRACVVVLNSAVRDTEQARAWLDLFGLHNPLARRLFNVCRMMPCTHLFVRQAPKNKQAHASAAQTLSTITVHRAICLSTRAHTHTCWNPPTHRRTCTCKQVHTQAGIHAHTHIQHHTAHRPDVCARTYALVGNPSARTPGSLAALGCPRQSQSARGPRGHRSQESVEHAEESSKERTGAHVVRVQGVLSVDMH